MTAAIFGFVGVVVGGVLSAVTSWLLQRSQDQRRWQREDASKFEPERLALYREFLNRVEKPPLGHLDARGLEAMLSEMELLSSEAVYLPALLLYSQVASIHYQAEQAGEQNPDPDRAEQEELWDLKERFNRAVREELGVTTTWDRAGARATERQGKHPWWQRLSGG